MAIEIERKFLVQHDSWRQRAHDSVNIIQAYMANTDQASIRVRIVGDQANLNIKKMQIGPSRSEFEYSIPLEDAREMLDELCISSVIEKTRHYLDIDGHRWEIDEFGAENQGLVVAEIELDHIDEGFTRPGWLGKEVTSEERYYNLALARHPYSRW